MNNAMEYLSGPRRIRELIRNREEKILALRSVASKTTTTLHLTAACSSSSEDHKLENIVAEIDRLEQENAQDEAELAALCIEINNRLDVLPNENHRTVLRLWYLSQLSTAEICRELMYSSSHIRRLKNDAIQEFKKMVPDVSE